MKAFPHLSTNRDDIAPGMDLRDYFAAKAMELTYKFWMQDYYKLGLDDGDTDKGFCKNQTLIAVTAYEFADEMMKARNE
jgi:hypothetical protein